jgi:hypothetical protein
LYVKGMDIHVNVARMVAGIIVLLQHMNEHSNDIKHEIVV